MELTLNTEQDMINFGRIIGEKLHGGLFIALFGDLGAGKTTLVKGVAASFNIAHIQSPTFTIVREYEASKLRLCHFDAYRLSDADELYAIGFDDYMTDDAVIIMEWPQNVFDALPSDRLDISLNGSGNEPRYVRIEPIGAKHAEFYGNIIKELSL